MKAVYPDYRALRYAEKGGVNWLEQHLDAKHKKILEDYLTHLKASGCKSRKINDYRIFFIQFMDIMEKPMNTLIPDDIVKFWALVNEDQSRLTSSKNHIKVTVKRFLKWYYSEDLKMMKLIPNLKLKEFLVNEAKINKKNLLTEKEMELLLRTAPSLKEKAQLITLYESAARPHELRLAKWGAVNWDDNTITVFATKTQKARDLPLKESMVHLKRWKTEYSYPNVSDKDFIFPSPYGRDKPISQFQFSYWIRELGKKAGITRNIYPYLLRHTRLTELKRKGVDDLDRKMFAGHSPTSKMQAVYVSIDNDDMKKSIIEKVYHVEDLPQETKHALEMEVEKLKQERIISEKKMEDFERKLNAYAKKMDKIEQAA